MTDTIKVTALERLRRDEAKFDAAAVRTRRMKFNIGGGVALLALALIVIAFFSLFTVPQASQALIVRLGDPVRTISEPGLHMKVPFIDSVIYVDNRILDLESGAEEVIASDSALRRVLGDFTLTQVLRDDRSALMARVRDRLDTEAQAFGIDVLDVRISRANLPTQNSQAVYQRMQTERQREAAEFRAQGSEKSLEIRARADRDVTVLIADATQGGEQARGDGDADRARIFAQAYGKDPEFYAFYRSMQAYEAALQPNNTRLVLPPDSRFFRFFGGPSGALRSK
jgi:membrane protease subunit HflC